MNTHAESRMSQMAAENVEAIHWLTWPIRELVGIIKTAIFLVIFIAAVPLVFIGLIAHFVITGHALLSGQDDILPLKIIFTFVAPFAVTIVYRFAQAVAGRSAAVRATYVFSMHKVFLITLGLMLLGAIVAFPAWDGMDTEIGFGTLVVYLSSPLLLLFLKRSVNDYSQPFPRH